MDRSFEYTVIAYLDGQLDPREERVFLQAVSADPEKQAILNQHRRLNDVLRDKKTPVAVPLRTQQALAQKLPALESVVPQAFSATVASSGGYLAGLSTGKLLGIIVAGTAFLGMFTAYMLTGGPEAADHTSQTVLQQTQARSDQRHAEPRTDAAVRDSEGDGVPSIAADAPDAYHAASEASFASETSAVDGADAARSLGYENAAAGRSEAFPPETRSTAPVSERETARHAIFDDLPLAAPRLAPRSGSQVTPATGEWPNSQSPTQALRELLGGRLHAYLETGAAQYDMQGSRGSSNTLTKGVYLAGLRYDISSRFALGVEIGQSTFAREGYSTERHPLTPGSGTEIVVVNNALLNETQPWLRAHMLWTVNPEDRLRLQADAGSGLLLGGGTPVIFSVGVSSVYALTHSLQARAGLHYSGTWLSPTGTRPEISSDSGVIGIIYNARNAGTVYSSAIEFRIGFGVLLW